LEKSLRIPSSYSQLNRVEKFIHDVLGECNIASRQVGFITLGVCESVTNAIAHGNKYDEAKFVTVLAEVSDNAVSFEIHDEGDGFDHNDIPDPTLDSNIKKEGGRGLYIIHNLVDEVQFKNNGSVIHLKFYIDRAHSFFSRGY